MCCHLLCDIERVLKVWAKDGSENIDIGNDNRLFLSKFQGCDHNEKKDSGAFRAL